MDIHEHDIQHYTSTPIQIKEHDMEINEHERLSNITLRHQFK